MNSVRPLMQTRRCLLSIVALMLVQGCVPGVSQPSTRPPGGTAGATATLATATVRPTPNSPTRGPTSRPTLTSQEAIGLVRTLLTDNGKCRLPCLWGLVPGETMPRELHLFFDQFGAHLQSPDFLLQTDDLDGIGGMYVFFHDGDLDIDLSLDYYLTRKELDMLVLTALASREIGEGEETGTQDVFGDEIYNRLVDRYLLWRFLSDYNAPTQILIAPFPPAPGDPALDWYPFSLLLFYERDGFLVEYISPLRAQGDNYVGCPRESHFSVMAWPAGRITSLERAVERKSGYGVNSENFDYFRSIDAATSMSPDQFINEFADPAAVACVETPRSLWPVP